MPVLDSGLHSEDSGSRILNFGFSKGMDSNFFFCFNALLRISFSCSNRAILKRLLESVTEFVFFFELQITGLNVLHLFKNL